MKPKNQIFTVFLTSLFSFNAYGWSFDSSEKFSTIFITLVLLGTLFILLSYFGFLSSDKKGKFFSENNVTNGLLIIVLVSIVVGSLMEITSGKFGVSTLLLVIYGLVFYFGRNK